MSEAQFHAELIYGLAKQHRIGSVCGNPCPQCGEGEVVMSGLGTSGRIDPAPLYILREATYEEYVASTTANGGGKRLSSPSERFYYAVSTD